ncbi:nuclear protein MDM1 isoform X2 [Amia ocellicauda]|uniref:nuclear protein MDM1 isoform X2 n=1 Tax=Amia ocellicauda TaxID=2972642 RepID=UPI003463F6E3
MKMPVRFKGVSEYQKKYKWQDSRSRSASPESRAPGAGLRSDQLGITKEPSFISKRSVPFYRPQVARSFQWAEGAPALRRERIRRPRSPSAAESPGRTPTPLAPRVPKLLRSQSADSRPESAPPPAPPTTGKKMSSVAAEERPGAKLNGVQRVLQKKAGLKPTLLQNPAHHSEYQRQFMWKEPPVSSPLLAAEQVIYNRNRDIPPFKSDAVVLESEYKRNFKGSPPPKGPRLRRDVEQREAVLYEPENVPPEKTAKKKKNRPLGHGPQNRDAQPGKCGEPQRARKQNPHQPFFPHRGYGKLKSEYNSNFRSPLLYRYRDGGWRKCSTAGGEVKELREKAEAYKRRARGTHFSREHLSQVLSEQNRLWEVSSSSTATEEPVSSTINALDLARAQGVRRSPSVVSPAPASPAGSVRSPGPDPELAGLHSAPTLPVQRRLVWEQEDRGAGAEGEDRQPQPEEQDEAQSAEDADEHKKEKPGKEVKAAESVSSAGPGSLSPESSECSAEARGRLPTPKMKTTGFRLRTHHDLTTPAIGGAILVSPPKPTASPQRRSEPPLGKPYSPYKYLSRVGSPPRHPHKAEESRSLRSPPAAGLQTCDPIPLREDRWPADPHPESQSAPAAPPASQKHRPGPQNRTPTPLSAGQPPARRIQGMLRDPEFQHNGNLGGARPGLFACSSSDSVSDNDERMSQISSRSAASSSRASQILERAQRRKDHFWGKS